jgi:hypothetical protein
MRRNDSCYARRSRRGDSVVARKTRNLRGENQDKLESGNPLRPGLLVRNRDRRIVTMVHPHAGRRGLGHFGVLEILCELVAVTISADGNGQREKRQDVRPEELPYSHIHFRVACANRPLTLNMRLRLGRDKEFVLHDVPGSSNSAARFYKYRLGSISFRCKILIPGVTAEVRRDN